MLQVQATFTVKYRPKDLSEIIKSRLAKDNVRRLLHIIDGAQSLSSPAAALLLDAMTAFDRLEGPFLWSVLEFMGIGMPFINIIKVLYKKSNSRSAHRQN